MKENNSSSFSLEDALDCIFEIIKKHNILTLEELFAFRASFRSFLKSNDLQPFTKKKEIFLKQLNSRILLWPKSPIEYPFLKSELKDFFDPKTEKPWFKFFSKYHFVFVLIISVFSMFISLSSLMLQIFKSK